MYLQITKHPSIILLNFYKNILFIDSLTTLSFIPVYFFNSLDDFPVKVKLSK